MYLFFILMIPMLLDELFCDKCYRCWLEMGPLTWIMFGPIVITIVVSVFNSLSSHKHSAV